MVANLQPLHAQQRHLSLELGGSGGIASLNYERSLLEKADWRLDMRIGFSTLPVDANNGWILVFPVMAHAILLPGQHRIDLGAGQAISLTTKGSFFLRAPLSLGYRFQPTDKRFYLRAAYTPIVSYLLDFQWEHWAGITLGYRLSPK